MTINDQNNCDIQSLQAKVEQLEKELNKQKKISAALKKRVKDSLNSSGSTFSTFENNVLLQTETERRTIILQQQKEKAEQENMAKSDFFASMSHELRSPMHAILSFSSLGDKKHEDADREKLKKYFSSINQAGERLLRLIDDLLDLAKLESGKFTISVSKNNLQKITENIIRENTALTNSKRININLTNDNTPTDAEFDADRTSQIIQNLLSNAIKFSPEDSTITVHCENTELDDMPAVKLSVSDQGIGIPHGEVDCVFEKYVQSSHNENSIGGTGLGLPICKELVNLHNGKIWVDNNVDKGTCFSFVLPVKHTEDPSTVS